MRIITTLLLLFALLEPGQTENVRLSVELGPINVEHGISCPNTGDGQTVPAKIGGRECRRNDPDADPKSTYMYFDVDSEVLDQPLKHFYVTVEYFDSGFGTFGIQYSAKGRPGTKNGIFRNGASELLFNSQKWRQVTFEFRDIDLETGADDVPEFRLISLGDLHVARVTVDTNRPEGYESQAVSTAARITEHAGKLHPHRGIRVVITELDEDPATQIARIKRIAPVLSVMGATSLATRVTWASVEPSKDQWDWTRCDTLASVLAEYGLKWTPVLAAEPPAWFTSSDQACLSVCLEHGEESRMLSPWCKGSSKWVSRFVNRFFEHHKNYSVIESLAINIQPDLVPPPVKTSHAHPGIWCGDKLARADWIAHIKSRYSNIGRVNAAWGTAFKSFDQIPLFSHTTKPSLAAWRDEVSWYRLKMTGFADQWLGQIRSSLPDAPVYLRITLGPEAEPGWEWTALAKVAGKRRCGLWVDYNSADYPSDFVSTRLLTSAARFYGAPVALEADEGGEDFRPLDRAYNGSTSSAFMFCGDIENLMVSPANIDAWKTAIGALKPESTVVSTAVFCPNAPETELPDFYARVTGLRDGFDLDLVDERMIIDGAMARYRALLWIWGEEISDKAAAAIESWIKQGGVLYAVNVEKLRTTDKGVDLCKTLLPVKGKDTKSRVIGSGACLRITADWSDMSKTVSDIARVLGNLSTRAGRSVIPDGEVDQVYVADVGDRLLILNAGSKQIERDITTGVGKQTRITVPAGSVIEVPLAEKVISNQ